MAVVAGLGADRVHAIVLSAASVPPEGGNGFDGMQARHRDGARQALAAIDPRGDRVKARIFGTGLPQRETPSPRRPG
jgi:hypothetical protein